MKNTDLQMMNEIGKILIKRGEALATAESVTSGKLQYAFSQAENTMDFFEGGITTYTPSQKIKLLEVDKQEAEDTNCVSENVAASMATGASKIFNTAWSVSITGYASPVPELHVEELFSCFAISYQGKILRSGRFTAPDKGIEKVIDFYCTQLLQQLLHAVRDDVV
jgi:nicotinamide-nucleotide amidase